MLVWVIKERIIEELPDQRVRTIFIYSCSFPNMVEDISDAEEAIRTNIRYLPAVTTRLTQPCDILIIQKIKLA